MDNSILNFYSKIPIPKVSRETCSELESLISMIKQKNDQINIISKKTAEINEIRHRHILDSAQIIDFIDLKSNTTCDLGQVVGCQDLL